MEYFLAIGKDKGMQVVDTWMDLERKILSKMSQRDRQHNDLTYMQKKIVCDWGGEPGQVMEWTTTTMIEGSGHSGPRLGAKGDKLTYMIPYPYFTLLLSNPQQQGEPLCQKGKQK